MVRVILRLEGLVVFLASLYFYSELRANWVVFILLLFAPDISMTGYVKDKKIGAILYNLIHNYIFAAGVVFAGIAFENPFIVSLGLILAAHVGLDRLLGFGLKYPEDFKDTHIQRI